MVSVAGGLTYVGAEVGDIIGSKVFSSRLKQLAEERDSAAKDLFEKLVRFEPFLEYFCHKLSDNCLDDNSLTSLLVKDSKNTKDLDNNSAQKIRLIFELKALMTKIVAKIPPPGFQ